MVKQDVRISFPFANHANQSMAYGQDLAGRGDFTEIERELARAKEQRRARSSSWNVSLGAALMFASLCEGLGAKGVKFTNRPPSQVSVLHFSSVGPDEFFACCDSLIHTIKAASAVGLKWGLVADAEPPKPAPREIRIVGMPERSTETKISRDADGDMIGSTAVENDRAK